MKYTIQGKFIDKKIETFSNKKNLGCGQVNCRMLNHGECLMDNNTHCSWNGTTCVNNSDDNLSNNLSCGTGCSDFGQTNCQSHSSQCTWNGSTCVDKYSTRMSVCSCDGITSQTECENDTNRDHCEWVGGVCQHRSH